jgi:hypothetical protein
LENTSVYVEREGRAPIERARHTYKEGKYSRVLRVASSEANPRFVLSNPRLASPLLIFSAYYLAFAKKNDEWCQQAF